MSEEPTTPKKVHPDQEELETLSKTDLINRIKEQEQYIQQLENKKTKVEKGENDVDRTQDQKDAARRESTLVHRLSAKEQELQVLTNQLAEVKQAQTQGTAQLRSMLLDPAVNTVFQKMAKEMEEAQEKLKQTQNELSAWKFTPDSQTGKRLMARCQMLLQENEELGKTIASGRTAKLEGEISLMKTLVTEMKNNQSELDEFLGDLEEDVEGMQTMIYVLQQQLREAKEQISILEEENSLLKAGKDSETIKAALQAKHHNKTEKTTTKTTKKEDSNHSVNDKQIADKPQQIDYTSVNTSGCYVNEKTDSELESEYNYEGLYENEDKYQEMEDTAGTEEGQYEYEENGYKNYEEEYESESQVDFRASEREQPLLEQDSANEQELELMDTSEEGQGNQVTSNGQGNVPESSRITSSHSSPIVQGSGKASHSDTTADSCSYSSSECSNADNISSRRSQVIDSTDRQHQADSVTGSSDSTFKPEVSGLTKQISAAPEASSSTCESRDSNHVTSTQRDNKSSPSSSNHHHNRVHKEHSGKERTPEREKNPSPKPTKVSPVNSASTKALTPEQDPVSSHEEHGSNNRDSNPAVSGGGEPVGGAESSPGEKVAESRTTRASSSPGNKSHSPSATGGGGKDKEPVLKFLNGVTSTVEDIEDI